MFTWIVVASGGALGCMARHGVNRLVHQHWPLMRFPAATVVVNLVGCCVIGALAGLIASGHLSMRTQWREFVFVGLLGGFTTFSTFGLDTVTLFRVGDVTQAFSNIVIQVVGGLAGVYAGLVLFERLGRSVQ
jgi:fluoride exporter